MDSCVDLDVSGLRQEVLERQSKKHHNVKASNPSILRPSSKDITAASVLLCDTEVCFWHVRWAS